MFSCTVGAVSATPAATPLGNLVLSMATPAMTVGQTPEMMQQVRFDRLDALCIFIAFQCTTTICVRSSGRRKWTSEIAR